MTALQEATTKEAALREALEDAHNRERAARREVEELERQIITAAVDTQRELAASQADAIEVGSRIHYRNYPLTQGTVVPNDGSGIAVKWDAGDGEPVHGYGATELVLL